MGHFTLFFAFFFVVNDPMLHLFYESQCIFPVRQERQGVTFLAFLQTRTEHCIVLHTKWKIIALCIFDFIKKWGLVWKKMVKTWMLVKKSFQYHCNLKPRASSLHMRILLYTPVCRRAGDRDNSTATLMWLVKILVEVYNFYIASSLADWRKNVHSGTKKKFSA